MTSVTAKPVHSRPKQSKWVVKIPELFPETSWDVVLQSGCSKMAKDDL